MNRVHAFAIVLIVVLVVASAAALIAYTQSSNIKTPSVYVGVAFGGTTIDQAELLIDRVRSYTNLFILNAGRNSLSTNQTAVTDICDYATSHGLSIIINLGVKTRETPAWQLGFVNSAKINYGDKFLGVYYDDEPMGIPFDWDWQGVFHNGSDAYQDPYLPALQPLFQRLQQASQTGQLPSNYSVEAQWYHNLLMRNQGHNQLKANNITTYTSDYLLYWYDFLGNYDTVFAQLIGSNTAEINKQISLIRGAATLQNKSWGTIITWSNTNPADLGSGETLYSQMATSYNTGAKFIIVFDYPYYESGNPYGILTDEHFAAMKDFWNQMATRQNPTKAHAEAALVLPKDYGSGLRSSTDRIWGIWPADAKTPIIENNIQKLLAQYGLNLDIVYDDPAYPLGGNYSRVYLWNAALP
jgi:hypothetical protein